ncbi:hypothetical protein NEHOM01_1237 [Nematocida homosporus]|uniref:uncharacterized protein n=1 Tax=Nematocida homosporus TaxID=1912981 RepID=UPI00221E3FB5|nr:uncharacterized protein NEHOM01_1237 [Nematocida homosporus]KAI5186034.1 hypothetical protein NEHOM01_1237 [Nematocida homosporus]
MAESVAAKSKYLEVPQEIRNKIVQLHSLSKEYKRKPRNYKPSSADEIEYRGIFQELKMVAISSEEVKRKAQEELSNLEDIRECAKSVAESKSDIRKEELLEMLKREISKGEDKITKIEEQLRVIVNRERKDSVLQTIQENINRISEKIEQLK